MLCGGKVDVFGAGNCSLCSWASPGSVSGHEIRHSFHFNFGHVYEHVAFRLVVNITTLTLLQPPFLSLAMSSSETFSPNTDVADQRDQLAEPTKPIPELPPPLSESLFHNTILEYAPCEEPDCILVSLEGVEFRTRKDLLATASGTFTDMFLASHSDNTDHRDERIELLETSHTISLLLTIVHSPPITFPPRERVQFEVGTPEPDVRREVANSPSPPGLLPFENVRELLHPIAQKYTFTDELVRVLKSHLSLHVVRHPLEVYTLACGLMVGVDEQVEEMKQLASDASQYLHSPTLSSLPVSTARKFPTAESFATLLRLQMFRMERLQRVLQDTKNTVFPFDYNMCKDHGVMTRKLWEARKKTLEVELDAGTDLALQMGNTVLPAVRHCERCCDGVTAAVEMIRVRLEKLILAREC